MCDTCNIWISAQQIIIAKKNREFDTKLIYSSLNLTILRTMVHIKIRQHFWTLSSFVSRRNLGGNWRQLRLPLPRSPSPSLSVTITIITTTSRIRFVSFRRRTLHHQSIIWTCVGGFTIDIPGGSCMHKKTHERRTAGAV